MKNSSLLLVIVTATAAALLADTLPVQAQSISNGSFEIGTLPAVGTQLNAVDSTSIPGWTVATGSIDYYTTPNVQAADGSRSLDLSGVDVGSISQVVNGFMVGNQYTLNFYMAGNPGDGPAVKSMTVSVGSASQTFSFDVTGHSYTSMGWTLESLPFTATSSSMLVLFQSLTVSDAGPALDNVSLVPEPSVSALAIMLAGLSYAWLRRRAV